MRQPLPLCVDSKVDQPDCDYEVHRDTHRKDVLCQIKRNDPDEVAHDDRDHEIDGCKIYDLPSREARKTATKPGLEREDCNSDQNA